MSRIAMLGAGIMAAPMTRNLLNEGLEVRVWNRTRAKAEALRADGAQVAGTAADAAADADVLITMLTDGDAVRAAMAAAGPGLRQGQVWAQMSTVGVLAVPELAGLAAEHGLVFVDAPVQGSRQPAEEGRLVILAAGPQSARTALERPFGAMGARTMWLGEDGASGAATRLKLAGVSYAISLTTVVAEAFALAEGLGVPAERLLELVSGGPMDNAYFQSKAKLIMSGDFTPTFTVRNAEKDTRLIAEAGAAHEVRMDLVEAARARFQRAERAGHGDEDMAASYFASFTG